MVDKSDSSLHLLIQPFTVNLAQYPSNISIPPGVFQSNIPFLSVTRTSEEVTLLYGIQNDEKDQAKRKGEVIASFGLPEPINQDGPYAVLRVRGPLNLALTGILNELTTPLRTAEVPIFAISTWDTDYVLVPHGKLDIAVQALQSAGWTFDYQS